MMHRPTPLNNEPGCKALWPVAATANDLKCYATLDMSKKSGQYLHLIFGGSMKLYLPHSNW